MFESPIKKDRKSTGARRRKTISKSAGNGTYRATSTIYTLGEAGFAALECRFLSTSLCGQFAASLDVASKEILSALNSTVSENRVLTE